MDYLIFDSQFFAGVQAFSISVFRVAPFSGIIRPIILLFSGALDANFTETEESTPPLSPTTTPSFLF
jgi:hypothetical protein